MEQIRSAYGILIDNDYQMMYDYTSFNKRCIAITSETVSEEKITPGHGLTFLSSLIDILSFWMRRFFTNNL